MKPSKVSLHPYSSEFRKKYEKEVPLLRSVVQDLFLHCYHIGSTAIPHIRAKPILDVLLVVKETPLPEDVLVHFEKLGYQYYSELGIAGRAFLKRNDNSIHLHIYPKEHPEIQRHIYFCEYMIAHPEKAQEYERVKEECAQKYPDNSFAYADAKSPFIRKMEQEAALWKETTCE